MQAFHNHVIGQHLFRVFAVDHLPDAVAAALTIPLATEWHRIVFAADAYWRGETHRLCDRPSGLIRLIDFLQDEGEGI